MPYQVLGSLRCSMKQYAADTKQSTALPVL